MHLNKKTCIIMEKKNILQSLNNFKISITKTRKLIRLHEELDIYELKLRMSSRLDPTIFL